LVPARPLGRGLPHIGVLHEAEPLAAVFMRWMTRIIYDKNSGNLYYDADGVGGAAQIRIAILSHKPSVSAHDFHVI
jgi:hypothetical protein